MNSHCLKGGQMDSSIYKNCENNLDDNFQRSKTELKFEQIWLERTKTKN